jgi:hypothetical protein
MIAAPGGATAAAAARSATDTRRPKQRTSRAGTGGMTRKKWIKPTALS